NCSTLIERVEWSIIQVIEDSMFFFQAEDGIRDRNVTGVQTCALPIYLANSTFADFMSREWNGPLTFNGITRRAPCSFNKLAALRSEERRVGKECKSRGSGYH